MVSIHNTIEFHNYTYELPQPPTFTSNPNTIYDYISSNHTTQSDIIDQDSLLKNNLNNPQLKHTIFLPITTNSDNPLNLRDYVYKGVFDVENYNIVSLSGKNLDINKNKVNNVDILVKSIVLQNGVIHIIKNNF
jgi:hypothetical protein